ncbi:MAG: AmmeMemoRadiSam system radical SAM enzyme [Acidobacteria bacterium]|nr:AmmeMemoRadiSam system radical SAM enzyme [Acidobacteriota bacterium]
MDRREFCRDMALGVAGLTLAGGAAGAPAAAAAGTGPPLARYWEKMPGKKVHCLLCPHECVVADGGKGRCRVRQNRGGTFYTLNYGQICAVHTDPIEKKPLFHYKPGASAFSIALPGCNLRCRYCQNWQISQHGPEELNCVHTPPGRTAAAAAAAKAPVIAYTYSEPVVGYEYLCDTADAARALGVGNVLISAGYLNPAPLKKLIPKMSAVKIDFKGFSDPFYHSVCGGSLKPVLDTLVTLKDSGTWLELVMLIVPTLNDNVAENRLMFRWIRSALTDRVPLHLTRFTPCYQLQNLPQTPVKTLETLHAEAKNAGLQYVYVGNVPGHPLENTYCHACRKMVIRRVGFTVVSREIRDGKCASCGTVIPGIFS